MGILTFIRGDITHLTTVHDICYQVNCLTVKASGLSANIASKYPLADVYAKRTSIGTRNLATKETRGTAGNVMILT